MTRGTLSLPNFGALGTVALMTAMLFQSALTTALRHSGPPGPWVQGCLSERNPNYCDENVACEVLPERPFCDLYGSFPASNGSPKSCIPDPFPCNEDGACPFEDRPFCDVAGDYADNPGGALGIKNHCIPTPVGTRDGGMDGSPHNQPDAEVDTGPLPQLTLVPSRVHFTSGYVGRQSDAVVVEIKNTGTVPVVDMQVAFNDATHFHASSDYQCEGTLEAGDSCQVRVVFDPEQGGQHSANLTVSAGGASFVAGVSGVAKTLARLVFPPPVSLAQTGTLHVRGVSEVSAGVTGVRVNGILTTSDDNFATWQATVNIADGATDLVVETNEKDGPWRLSGASAKAHGSPASLGMPGDMVVDIGGTRALVVDWGLRQIVAFDLSTGAASLISGATRGSGELLVSPDDIDIHDGNTALATDSSGLVWIDLQNGDRTELSGANTGSGVAFRFPYLVRIDAPRNRAIVVAQVDSNAALLAVDLASGARSLLSAATRGAGPMFDSVRELIVNASGTHAYLQDRKLEAVLSVSLTTGNRTIIADETHGTGHWPNGSAIGGFHLIPDENAALLLWWSPSIQICRMDLQSGNRTTLPAITYEPPPPPHVSSYVQLQAINPTTGDGILVDIDGSNVVVVDPETGSSRILAGFGLGSGSGLSNIEGLCWDSARARGLALSGGASEVLLAVDLSGGDRTAVSKPGANPGPRFGHGVMGLDPSAGRVLVASDRGELVAIDLSNGVRSMVASETVGSGPVWDRPVGIAIDSDRSRAFVLDGGTEPTLVAVSLDTGERTMLSDATHGTGSVFSRPQGLTSDVAGQRLIAVDGESLIAVDAANGNRTLLSGEGVGSGPDLTDPRQLVIDVANNRALIVQREGSIIAADLATGNRSLVSGASRGMGPTIEASEWIAWGPDGVLLVATPKSRAIVVVDPETGDRVVVSR